MAQTVPFPRISAMCRRIGTVIAMAQASAFEDFCANPLPPHTELVCLETASEVQALAAFDAIADSRSLASSRLIDVSVRSPSESRWKASDALDVLHLLSLAPQHRRVLLLLAADVFDPSTLDMLLKAIEEPPAPLTLAFAAPAASALPATLKSRLLHVFTLPAALPDGAEARLKELALPLTLLERSEVHDLVALLAAAPLELSAPLASSLCASETPALAAAEFFSRFEALLTAFDLPSDVKKRLVARAPRLALAVFESNCYADPDRFISEASLAAHRDLKQALDLSLNPLPHLTGFFLRTRPSQGSSAG